MAPETEALVALSGLWRERGTDPGLEPCEFVVLVADEMVNNPRLGWPSRELAVRFLHDLWPALLNRDGTTR